VPAQWLVILDSIIAIMFNILTFIQRSAVVCYLTQCCCVQFDTVLLLLCNRWKLRAEVCMDRDGDGPTVQFCRLRNTCNSSCIAWSLQVSTQLIYLLSASCCHQLWHSLSVFKSRLKTLVGNSQVIGCEDCLRNDLYCVRWGIKLYSIQSNLG